MTPQRIGWSVVAAAALSGCASYVAVRIEENLEASGTLIHKYEAPEGTYYVIRSGPKVRKWRTAGEYGREELLYEVDVTIQICKMGSVVVDCAAMKRDRDLAPFITW